MSTGTTMTVVHEGQEILVRSHDGVFTSFTVSVLTKKPKRSRKVTPVGVDNHRLSMYLIAARTGIWAGRGVSDPEVATQKAQELILKLGANVSEKNMVSVNKLGLWGGK